jgi:enterochelin esterase-like enzyme
MISMSLFAQESGLSNIHIIKNIESNYVSKRDIYIRLPKDYNLNNSYPVLYMHDGQMLFSGFKTWNGQHWGVDETISDLVSKDSIQDVIVVGIANVNQERHANYFPEKPFLNLPKAARDSLYKIERGSDKLFKMTVNSDDYLKFIVFELKPFIDSNYATARDKSHTFIAGSSMGGLISMYAFFEYPEIFGGAACLSTHWIGGFSDNQIIPNRFKSYIENRKSLIADRKLYFDTSTETLDQDYQVHQKNVDALFESEELNQNYLSKIFEGASHTENDWKSRFHIPLIFFLK